MTDWNLDKIDDIAWDEVFENHDHWLPYQGGEYVTQTVAVGNPDKKPQHEIEDDAVKSTVYIESVSKNVLKGKEPTVSYPPLKDGNSITADVKYPNYTFKECKKDVESNSLCSEILQNTGAADNSCHFSLPAATRLEGEHSSKDNDLWNYDWPDIGNIVDADILFRNCDFTFEQRNVGIGDELSWFSSSSHAVCGSEDTFRSTVQSSVSKFSVSESTVECHGTSTEILPDTNLQNIGKPSSHGNLSLASVSGGENKGESAHQGHNSKIIVNIKEMEEESSCKGKRKHQPSECMNGKFFLGHGQLQQFADEKLLSAVISNQPHSSQLFPQHYWGSDSSGYASTFGPQVRSDNSLLSDQLQSMQTTSNANSGTEYNPSSSCIVPNNATSCIPQIMERFPDPLSKPTSATPEFTNEQDVSACITPIQNELIFQQWIGDGSGDITSTKLPKNVMNSSVIQETSCLTYGYPDDALLKASSFQHLQGVVDQLNVGAKLCIRDSLYRLARNVVERHIFPNNTNDRGEGGIQKRAQGTESEKRCTESVDIETHTNPMDRSVAHLLFHRPLELAARSADAVLLGSLLIK